MDATGSPWNHTVRSVSRKRSVSVARPTLMGGRVGLGVMGAANPVRRRTSRELAFPRSGDARVHRQAARSADEPFRRSGQTREDDISGAAP